MRAERILSFITFSLKGEGEVGGGKRSLIFM